MQTSILALLEAGHNVILVAPSNAGKTHFALNTLKPFLESAGRSVCYFPDMLQDLSVIPQDAIVIFDEFEVLEDQAYLEQLHPNERPYYEESYLQKVHLWLDKARTVPQPRIFIVTRDAEEVEHFKGLKAFSFAQSVRVLEFRRDG